MPQTLSAPLPSFSTLVSNTTTLVGSANQDDNSFTFADLDGKEPKEQVRARSQRAASDALNHLNVHLLARDPQQPTHSTESH